MIGSLGSQAGDVTTTREVGRRVHMTEAVHIATGLAAYGCCRERMKEMKSKNDMSSRVHLTWIVAINQRSAHHRNYSSTESVDNGSLLVGMTQERNENKYADVHLRRQNASV